MKRREFIRLSASAGLGLAMPGLLEGISISTAADRPPDVAVVKGSSPAAITEVAIKALGGMGRFVTRGDIVVVKPNIGWDRTPEQAANTNPEVVSTVVRLCLEAGARKVKVFDRPVNDPRRCYVQSGIKKALEPLDAELKYVEERRFRDMSIGGEVLSNWPIYTEAVEADKIINVPIAKHHGLATLTMSMKNWMGVMGGNRSRIHQKLDAALADMAGFMKPALTVLDAVRVLVANGPQGGSIADVRTLGTVVAGVDQVAVDTVGAGLMGVKPDMLGYIREGELRGLGTSDLGRINIKEFKI